MAEQNVPNKLGINILSSEQQEKLRQFKIKTRIENESYLMAHPEVELMIGDFLRNVLLKRPDDILEFAADHFTNPNLHINVTTKVEENSFLD
ncbi:RIIa domain-containing protein 1 [Cynoglossus semilaevis]|uniref:RIIa domain-containing protein 1 n=1 Tax=Cynoglossus semilaevis TaxID=244447 RepID=UPI0004950498|nr:RIIa domain-containing protein 1 [Cynoglossus semilaevis]